MVGVGGSRNSPLILSNAALPPLGLPTLSPAPAGQGEGVVRAPWASTAKHFTVSCQKDNTHCEPGWEDQGERGVELVLRLMLKQLKYAIK